MRVIAITGGRKFGVRSNFRDGQIVERVGGIEEQYLLNTTLDDAPKFDFLVAGDASGADELAIFWAQTRKISHARCYADWNAHGKAAGPIRNRFMLEHFKPERLYAFAGGRGTKNCVSIANKLGIEVIHATPQQRVPE